MKIEKQNSQETASREKHHAFMRGFKHGASMAAVCEKHDGHATLSEPYHTGYQQGDHSRLHAAEVASQLYGYRPSMFRDDADADAGEQGEP